MKNKIYACKTKGKCMFILITCETINMKQNE